MKKNIFGILILIIVITTYSGLKNYSSKMSDSESNHIKYFGFTLIDTYWDDPTDNELKNNYADEVYNFSNVSDILILYPTDNIEERIKKISNLEMKSILHVSEIFFEQTGTGGDSGVIFDLRKDYEKRWNEFVKINNIKSHTNSIQAFYLGEEPTWNSISFLDLESASELIKGTIPEIPIMIIEASPVINDLQIPLSVDWVGFDHYFIKNPKSNSSYTNELNLLKTRLVSDTQKIVIIMDSHYIQSAHKNIGGINNDEMSDVAINYYNLAVGEPKVIAILGYFWPSGFDNPDSIGARNMSQKVKDTYVKIGKQITKKK